MLEYISDLTVECPHCGGDYDIEAWTLVFENETPEAVDMLVDGVLFDYECPHCGNFNNVDLPTLYADREKKVLICYLNQISELADAQSFISNRMAELGMDENNSHVRLVSTQNELREKVMLLKNGLDDRIVEILKLWCLDMVRDEGYEQKFEEVRCGVLEEGYLNVDFVGENSRHIRAKRSYYDRMAKAFKSELEKEGTLLEVNMDWAINFASVHNC